jgi:hydroxypyruvate isomerase
MQRRTFIATAAASGLAAIAHAQPEAAAPQPVARSKGRLRQSICRWCFGGMSVDALSKVAAEIGYASIELLGPDEWHIPKAHGLTCALATNVQANPISKGLNRVEHHDAIISQLEERLPQVAAAGIPQQIVFSGNRAGMNDREGLVNCAAALKRITPTAEKLGVTLVMELLNSKVDHADYMCDRSPWGFELVKRVGSPRFKLLYDIYHMQIMEGDVIRTITENAALIGHYHTAGVPGRQDLDGAQELNYRAICEAIANSGFEGYLAQEFMPKAEPIAALRQAFDVCSV